MKPKAILSLTLVATQIAACTHSPRNSATDQATRAQADSNVSRDLAGERIDDDVKGRPANFDYQYKGTARDLVEVLRGEPGAAENEDWKLLKTISARRAALLTQNLHDTGVDPAPAGVNCAELMKVPHRTATGLCYYHGTRQLEDQVRAGDNEQRFGRNTPAAQVGASQKFALMDPNPREVSKKLFTRKNGQTREADIINVLAAAWLQAQNHDWFTHGKNTKDAKIEVPRVSGDEEFPSGMDIPATTPDKSTLDRKGYAQTFRNNVTHWWDASHIYGSDQATIDKVRTNPLTGKKYDDQLITSGHIAVDMKNRKLYYDAEGLPITGFNDNWWIGLELIHSLFAMEHNHIANELRRLHPKMKGEEIFQKARLINAALIAKIHTVEWTPALLDNKILHAGMYSNWYGMRSALKMDNKFLRGVIGKFSPEMQHALSGVVGPKTLFPYGVPFTLTQEFVAVYRMHPLIPETVSARSLKDGKDIVEKPVAETIFRHTPGLMTGKDAALKWMYGFGTRHPGGLLLNNHPTFMQNMRAERNTGASSDESNTVQMDLAAVDIIRDRERQVPRYNDFRRMLRLKPVATFEELTDDANEVAALKEVYGTGPDAVEKLDLLVGTLAEKDRYAGFAFGNTPFYIFALMASRRLMADPFYSDYFTAKVYTKFGINWVQNQTMIDVLKRHHPELTPKLSGVKNAFRPWQPVYDQVKKKYSN